MSEQAPAASSPAEVDVFGGQEPTFAEYSQYRQSGELPARFKPAETADPAPADKPETASEGDEPESAGESEAPKDQHQEPIRKPRTAAQRIAQIEAAVEKEWDKDEPDVIRIAQLNATISKIRGGSERKTEPAPVTPPQSQPIQQQPQYTRPKPTAEDKNQDGSAKYGTYEEFVEELADWKAEQRWVNAQREVAAHAQAQELEAKVAAARTRHENFDEIHWPALNAIVGNQSVAPAVKAMLNDSANLPDVLFTIGSDPKTLASFVAMAERSPGQALRYIAKVESLIDEELAKGSGEDPPEKAPEPKKSQAPKPPSPVGGASSRAFDVSDESLSADDWARKRNQQVARRNRG